PHAGHGGRQPRPRGRDRRVVLAGGPAGRPGHRPRPRGRTAHHRGRRPLPRLLHDDPGARRGHRGRGLPEAGAVLCTHPVRRAPGGLRGRGRRGRPRPGRRRHRPRRPGGPGRGGPGPGARTRGRGGPRRRRHGRTRTVRRVRRSGRGGDRPPVGRRRQFRLPPGPVPDTHRSCMRGGRCPMSTTHAAPELHDVPEKKGAWTGTAVRRKEDTRLLSGTGTFVDDITLPRMVHAQFVRSTVASGRLLSVDLSEVRRVPGVIAAYTAADLDLNDITAVLDRPLEEFVPTGMPILARDRVRFAGEPVAIVIAEDAYAVEDGVEAAQVEYEVLNTVHSEEVALAEGAPTVHDEAPGNTLLDVSMFATEGIDDVFDSAHCVVRLNTRSSRQNALPLETRGVVASWSARDENLLVQTCTQVPHTVR